MNKLGSFSILYSILRNSVNPVRNSSGALNPAGIILGLNPVAKQRGIISNGVKEVMIFKGGSLVGVHVKMFFKLRQISGSNISTYLQ